MLALCLLNGEVLHNGRPANPRASKMTVSKFLKASLFDEFNNPSNQHVSQYSTSVSNFFFTKKKFTGCCDIMNSYRPPRFV